MTFLTEAEAVKHRCPFFTFAANEESAIHGGQPVLMAHENCSASACGMAWRWYTNDEPERVAKMSLPVGEEFYEAEMWTKVGDPYEPGPRQHFENPGKLYQRWERTVPAVSGTGFCGIAGVPKP